MDKSFKSLERLFQFQKVDDTIWELAEALSAIFAGVFFHVMITEYSNVILWSFICTAILFIYLFIRRLLKKRHFAMSALGELKATIEVRDAKRDIDRKDLINDYIEDAIKALNQNTCDYQDAYVENHLCDQSLTNGLTSVCSPFFNNPQNLLDSPKARFTVGAYVNNFFKIPEAGDEDYPLLMPVHDIFIPRDDLDLKGFLSKDILTDLTLTGVSFALQSQFAETFRHSSFVHNHIEYNRKLSVITAPIPLVCEAEGCEGILFIIAERMDNLPEDLEKVMQIFARLFTNWLTRYNQCVLDRSEKLMDQKVAEVQTARPTTKAPVLSVQNESDAPSKNGNS